jgi:S1-C subfamily serine protease
MRLPAEISKARIGWCVAIFLVAVTASTVLAESPLETVDREVRSIYETSKDAVVKVHAFREFQVGNLLLLPAYRRTTGFFIDRDGHILTTATAVDDMDTCWIDWRGHRIGARIIGRDPQTNVAMLKIDPEDGQPTPFLPQGDSDALGVGSMVIAIAFPYDLPSEPVVGFVRGMDLQSNGRVFPTTHIRADCRLRPGEGGGPLLNVHGEVVGMAVAVHADGQCCALPISAARKISQDILEFGQAEHPWVGLGVADRQLAAGSGSAENEVLVQQVYSNTPAAVAGFCSGDILICITSNQVHHTADVLNTMFYHRAGDRVEFTVRRNGVEQKLVLTVGNRPLQEAFGYMPVPQSARPAAPDSRTVALPVSER